MQLPLPRRSFVLGCFSQKEIEFRLMFYLENLVYGERIVWRTIHQHSRFLGLQVERIWHCKVFSNEKKLNVPQHLSCLSCCVCDSCRKFGSFSSVRQRVEAGYFIMYLNFMRDVTLSTQCHHHSHLLWPNLSKVYIIYYGAKRIDLCSDELHINNTDSWWAPVSFQARLGSQTYMFNNQNVVSFKKKRERSPDAVVFHRNHTIRDNNYHNPF